MLQMSKIWSQNIRMQKQANMWILCEETSHWTLRRKEVNESSSLRCVSRKSRWMTHRMFSKKEELNQNKENIAQQARATCREHDDIERKCSHFLSINYLYCNNDRREKEKDRDIDVAKKSIHERDKTTEAKWNQQSNCNNETNVEKERDVNNFNSLALIESKDVRETRERRRRWKV